MLKRLTACFFFFLACSVNAQSFSLYQNITTGNGLPSNYVFAVCEDEKGFLWAGTDKGLCRYDGFRWRVWDKDNGLPGNYINQVFSDLHGGLWLCISEKGYFHFNPSTHALQSVPLAVTPIYSLQTDADGNLYTEEVREGALCGLLIRPGNASVVEYVFRHAGKSGLLLRGNAKKGFVYGLYSREADWQATKALWKGAWPLRPVKIKEGVLKGQTPTYVNDSVAVSNTDYFHLAPGGELLHHHSLFAKGNSYGYACAVGNGLYVYDVKTGYYFINSQHQKTFFNSSTGLGTDYVNHIYQTRDGTVVLATLGAGLQLIKARYRKTFSLASPVRTVQAVGRSWNLLSGDHYYQTDAGETLRDCGPCGSAVLTFLRSGDTVVSGGLKGLRFFKQSAGALRPLHFLEFNAGISSVIATGKSFIAGTYGGGLARFTLERLLSNEGNFPLRIVERLVPVAWGYAALSYEDGLWLMDTVRRKRIQLTQKDGLLSNSVYGIHAKGDTLWIGTKGGVSVVVNNKVVSSFAFAHGAEEEKAVLCFHDKHNGLWAVSSGGLYQMRNGAFHPVGSHPLVNADDVITTAAYNELTNELGIGSNKTFSIVSLDAIAPSSAVLPPQLTQQTLDGNHNPSTTLPYNFSSLQFTLAPGVVSPFARSRFYYRLGGLSEDWRPLTDSLTLSFSGLRPGEYSLLAKAINADGYESATTLLASFTVQKPVWQRWPFLLGCALVVVFITALAVRGYEKQKQKKREATLLLQRTLQAERERIAKDLHDHLGTNLTTIIAQTDNIETRLHKGDAQQAASTVQRLSAHTRETMNVLRETIWAVRETEHSLQEFVLRMRSFLQRFFEGTDIRWQVNNEAKDSLQLSPAQTLHLFRIVQEASQNILKHAGATVAVYTLSFRENHLQLDVQDNGCGINGSPGFTNGLTNVQERARQLGGTATIVSQPSVKITVRVPVGN